MGRDSSPRRARRRSIPLAIGAASSLAFLAVVSGSLGVTTNSRHDFVRVGLFTGGGVCAECHIPHGAQEARLWPRIPVTASTTYPARGCMDCHGKTTPPSSPGWAASWTTVPPDPSGSHDLTGTQRNCTLCHPHAEGFPNAGDNSCLTCHTPTGFAASREVDTDFAGIGFDATTVTKFSQHNIAYTADSDLGTPDTADGSNGQWDECKKCHGDRHPKRNTAFLVYPRAIGSHTAGAPIAFSSDKAAYQEFCLACHNGSDNTGATRLNGAIPANQVPPSDRTNPAVGQSGVPWVVPGVPPRAATPYFANYESNGHGAPLKLITAGTNVTMDVTCLAGGTGRPGCHVVHGSQSRFLLYDGPTTVTQPSLGTQAITASGVATLVCYGCHAPANLRGDSRVSTFHSWRMNDTVLHDDGMTDTGYASVLDGMSKWRRFNGAMNITWTTIVPAANMPFYTQSGNIEARTYLTGSLTESNWTHCLTCHDPHGTAVQEADTPGLGPGMLRVSRGDWSYDATRLCGMCHSQ